MAANSWIRRLGQAPAGAPRLVCLPHAGGTAGFYRPLAGALAGRVEVLAVQYPGRQERLTEPPLDSIDDLADAIAGELLPWLSAPVGLFGHSMGGSVAFEVTLRLERAGDPVARLFASGRAAPSRHRPDQIHRRDDRGLAAELRRLAGTDLAILDEPGLLDIVLPAFRADITAVETYRGGADATVRCPVTALHGADDPTTTLDEVRAWAAHTTGPCEVVVLPGDHFYLSGHTERLAGIVAERLGAGGPRVQSGAAET